MASAQTGKFQSLIGFKINWNLPSFAGKVATSVSIPNRV